MRSFQSIGPAAALLLLAGTAAAQTPGPNFDIAQFTADLADPAKHDAALAQLKTVDESTIVPLWDAIADNQLPIAVRKDISVALPAVYVRLRKARAAHDQPLADAWNKSLGTDLYEQLGKKSPKWDDAVKAGFSDHQLGDRVAHFKAAIDAGCDDPVVRFYKQLADEKILQTVFQEDAGMEISAKANFTLAKEIGASSYPDAVKFRAYCHTLYIANKLEFDHDISDAEFADTLDKVIALVPAFAAAKPSDASTLNSIEELSWLNDSMSVDHKAVHDKLRPALAKAFPTGPWLDYFDGYFQMKYAWDARGNGAACTVPDYVWDIYHKRLDEAASSFDRGWRLDPLNSLCAASMITVCMGKDEPRNILDSWFSRALLADPEDRQACINKMRFLEPQWSGSLEEQLSFARDCIRLGNSDDRISMVAVDMIHRNQPEELPATVRFMARPEIWKVLQPAFESLLADKNDLQHNRPIYLHDRAIYLKYACQCQQWQSFIDLARQFGDEISIDDFGGKELFAYYMKKANDKVAKAR